MRRSRAEVYVLELALLGGAIGLRHALEADHLAAVATLVEDGDASALTGAAWGVGHSVPIVALGALFVGAGVRLPAVVATAFEVVVAAGLVGLGVWALAGGGSIGTSIARVVGRTGGGTDATESAGDGEPDHRHHTVAGRRVGLTHTHPRTASASDSHADEASFAVGVVHGVAGSGGVVAGLAATARTPVGSVGFLAGFAVVTVVTMALLSWGWRRVPVGTDRLRTLAGLVSLAVGVALLADLAGVVP
jgi:hypothetical protein